MRTWNCSVSSANQTVSRSQILQNAWIIKKTVKLLCKFWRKYQSVSYSFSCTIVFCLDWFVNVLEEVGYFFVILIFVMRLRYPFWIEKNYEFHINHTQFSLLKVPILFDVIFTMHIVPRPTKPFFFQNLLKKLRSSFIPVK